MSIGQDSGDRRHQDLDRCLGQAALLPTHALIEEIDRLSINLRAVFIEAVVTLAMKVPGRNMQADGRRQPVASAQDVQIVRKETDQRIRPRLPNPRLKIG